MTDARTRPVVTGKVSFCRFRRQETWGAAGAPNGRDSSWRFSVGALRRARPSFIIACTTMTA
jgi:hypothetical protein